MPTKTLKKPTKRKYLPVDPHKRGKILYLVYKYDNEIEELSSDGPYTNEKEAYDIMHKFLGEGICCWVVMYNG